MMQSLIPIFLLLLFQHQVQKMDLSLLSMQMMYLKDFKNNEKEKSYHLFVLVSTVLPCTSKYFIKNFYDKKIFNFGYCYSPAFIALGQIIKDFLNPDFLLIGQSDKKAEII